MVPLRRSDSKCVTAAGGSTANAQQFLNDANAAKAAGDFKAAYASYRKAYKAAGK